MRTTFCTVRYLRTSQKPVVDPEFPRQGVANTQSGGPSLLFGQIVPKNCMKTERNWTQWGEGEGMHPLFRGTVQIL